MFTLKFVSHDLLRGWQYNERYFTAKEHRTAVEVARSMQAQPDKFRQVRLIDFRVSRVSVPVLELPDEGTEFPHLYIPHQVGSSRTDQAACCLVDLNKLPRATNRKLPAKTVRKSSTKKVAVTV